jgi:hypothetical protein
MLRQAVLAIVLLAVNIAVGSVEPAIESRAFAKRKVAISARKAFGDADACLLPFESHRLATRKLAAANAFPDARLLAVLPPIDPSGASH